jgi:hypothetical protein
VRLRRLLSTAAALLVAVLVGSLPLHAQQTDVIRGRVIGPDSAAIENATVTATSLSGNVTRSARTDKNGRFTITVPGGEGDYIMAYTALGFAVRRFEIKRTADEQILVADARLSRVSTVLDAVTVNATRDRPGRNDAATPDISGTEQRIAEAALPPALLGDLAAMAASLPGVMGIPGADGGMDGFSVLGLGADQNNTTLNGMNFGGSNLPRDAAVSSSLTTSPYDVSRGGFSGAQFSLRSRPGSNFINRGMSLNMEAPQLQWTDRAAQALGQQYSNLSAGGSLSGPLVMDKAFYNVAYQLGRRSSDFQSLLNTSPLGLQAAGIAVDSVARLLGLLQQSGVPATVGGLPSSRLSDQGSVFGSFDFAPPASTSGQAINVAFNGSWNRQNPAGGGFGGFGGGGIMFGPGFGSSPATTLPSNGGQRTNWNGGVQARHNNYYGFGILSETSVGVSQSRNSADPYLALPGGRVRVNSTFEDGTSGVQTLAFGGNQGMSTSQTSTSASFLNQLSWFSLDNKHRIKSTVELRHDAFSQDQTINRLGSFAYNSLADLEVGRAASFTRQLSPRRREASQLTAGLSLGDAYRYSPDLQFQYGIRVDANRFMNDPALNAAVEQAFGTRNDHVPNRVFLSPRLGFSWTYGTAAQIGAFEGAMRGPRAVVRGGVGIFQNTPGTTLIGNAIDNTGLASAIQQLTCVGPASPAAQWAQYAANPELIPQRCADGSLGSVFNNNLPNVTLFSPNYAAPRSVRSNLQWNGPLLDNRFSATLEATYSRNQNQSSMVDLNFDPTSRFTLDTEGGRPVFAQPTSIVPATGAVALGDARLSSEFNRVTELRSDLSSDSRQISARISPTRFSSKYSWSLSYVYSNVREQVRGFSSTVGNPLDVEWARSSFDSRHQIVYNVGYNLFDAVRLNWFGQFRSGVPFTPTISGDVNGDGYSNDRAFVFDPAGAGTDPALAPGMQSLLAGGSDAARECLRRQMGRLAARNSCQGPWTSNASLSISFNPMKLRLPQRATLSFFVTNPLGAADMLLHGEDNLRGWGQFAFADPALLYVRGFDPATKRYKYEVNQRFGATNPAATAIRAPVTLTAALRVDMGPTRERQMLTQQLDRGRRTQGTKAPEPLLKAVYGSGGVANPMTTILRQQDTLQLTGVQADSIASMNRRYLVKLDSIWAPVARYFGALPNNYDRDDAYGRYRRAREASVDMLMQLAPAIRAVLTPEQIRKLPPFIATSLDTRYLASIRSGTAGGGGGMMMPGGMPMMGGGGGGPSVIIR